jgi:hypothetical protein
MQGCLFLRVLRQRKQEIEDPVLRLADQSTAVGLPGQGEEKAAGVERFGLVFHLPLEMSLFDQHKFEAAVAVRVHAPIMEPTVTNELIFEHG